MQNIENRTSSARTLQTSGSSPLHSICRDTHDLVVGFLNSQVQDELLLDVQKQLRKSLEVAENALSQYNLQELSLAYNGGKDCIVLLVIYLAAVYSHYGHGTRWNNPPQNDSHKVPFLNGQTGQFSPLGAFPESLKSIYIQSAHPFPEVEEFVLSSSHRYHLSLSSSSLPMKAAFSGYLAQDADIKAIFVGTRRTDPHGGSLTHFDETDRGWPKFMRIHPVIDWHYQEIWAFIRHLQIPYCPLYDLGYTSIGGTTDTFPNPKLRIDTVEPGSNPPFRAAYELKDDEEERLGREQ